MTDLADRLARRTLELVDIASESRHEAEIMRHTRALVPAALAPEYDDGDAVLFSGPRPAGAPFVVLAGHLDTVPAQDNLPGRIEDGAVHGLGAADMKGGVAVALELVRDLADAAAAVDVALLLFAREELPPDESALPPLFAGSQLVHEADLAILLEPTSCALQAGCVGTLNARITFTGRSGHAARPWLADNAIEHAIDGLAPVAALGRHEVVVGGLPFYEVVTITRIEGGIANNVVPDRVTAHLDARYAPGRSPESAEGWVRSLLPGASVEFVGNSPGASVVTDSPLVRSLQEAGELVVEPKQAWTNTADFTSRGIDAVNFGPGDPAYAHRRDERVDVAALVRAYEVLRRFLAG
jgi:succinyl-diaminopimelate desuccinylase